MRKVRSFQSVLHDLQRVKHNNMKTYATNAQILIHTVKVRVIQRVNKLASFKTHRDGGIEEDNLQLGGLSTVAKSFPLKSPFNLSQGVGCRREVLSWQVMNYRPSMFKKTSPYNVFVVSSMWGWFGQQKEAKFISRVRDL